MRRDASPAFDPVDVPRWPAGGVPDAVLLESLWAWLSGEPVQALAKASGWGWAGSADPRRLLGELCQRCVDWDFRRNRERGAIESDAAVVGDRLIPGELAVAAARALGMVDATEPPLADASRLVVLAGAVRANVNRLHRARSFQRGEPRPGDVVVTTAARDLSTAERSQADALGLTEWLLPGRRMTTEADAVVAAARATWELRGLPEIDGRLPDGGDGEERTATAWLRWPGGAVADVTVVVAPSADPDARRANTFDQLTYWRTRSPLTPRDHVVAVTTQIYVPYQQLVAIRALGRPARCGVTVAGVDAAASVTPTKAFGSRDYLQEIRSFFLAAADLLKDVDVG
ncbi:hypothetical protein [Protofrankia coriariae]|uniref:Uncharacterized protein n=1 Tax=Protofrankia coriariae TaxID=1562887 RepID=A0ABR5F6Q3_9ACTN|nr:hypothetical protein [Protofrankia coriariae]KLL12411.1 hypothetical protein FrCorBMG51_05285 [Protofrankia coriariae]